MLVVFGSLAGGQAWGVTRTSQIQEFEGVYYPIRTNSTTCTDVALSAAVTAMQALTPPRNVLMLSSVDGAGAACTWTLAADVTVPRGITFQVPDGAAVSVNTGKTLTLNGPVVATDTNWWSGAGSVVLTYRDWSTDGMTSFLSAGCLPTTSGSTTLSAFGCSGQITSGGQWYPVEQAAASVGPLTGGDGLYWLAIHRDTTTAVSGWTRQAGTHYLWKLSATKPTTPADTFIVAQVVVSGGAVTAPPALVASKNPTKFPGPTIDLSTVGADVASIQYAVTTYRDIYVPCGTYALGTTTLTIPNNTRMRGGGENGCAIFTYSGNGSAMKWTGFINSSGYANVHLSGFQVLGSGGANVGAGIEFVGAGAYIHLDHVRITTGFKYGVIFDQSQVSSLTNSIIENGLTISGSIGVWLTNGPEWTVGNLKGFTNILTIARNQINGPETGITDNGGNGHAILNNNFNATPKSIRLATVSAFRIEGNTFEYTAGSPAATANANVEFSDSTLPGSVVNGCAYSGVIQANHFGGNMVAAGISSLLVFGASTCHHEAIQVTGNFFNLTLGRDAAIDLTRLADSTVCENYDYGAVSSPGTYFFYTGIHHDSLGNTLCYGNGTNANTPKRDVVVGRADVPGFFAGGIQLGQDHTLAQYWTAAVTWDPANVVTGSSQATTTAITGVTVGSRCIAAHSGANFLIADRVWVTCKVSATGTVRTVLYNAQGSDFDCDSGLLYLSVFQ
jgi:hypothetical protein